MSVFVLKEVVKKVFEIGERSAPGSGSSWGTSNVVGRFGYEPLDPAKMAYLGREFIIAMGSK